MLQFDNQVQEALKILEDKVRYQKILTEGEKSEDKSSQEAAVKK